MGIDTRLTGRAISVCASGAAWLTARHAWLNNRGATERPLLVAGPGLAHADAEISEIAKSYPTSRRLTGAAATVAATLASLDGAPTAHLAAHGHHGHENALFSHLDLADGPLMAYDLPLLAKPPRQVTLSACALGRTTVRAGDETLGFTTALLYAGTANVISSVAQVDDHAAATVMAAYHRAIAAGAPPAAALATASTAAPLAPFVFFGVS